MHNKITVVDARMGRGKSTAAIRYMNENKGEKRFLYITPYLDEVCRICEQCDFDQSDPDDHTTKSAELKKYLKKGCNVAATHSLFYLIDEAALELIKKNHYSLIIDESIQVIGKMNISSSDCEMILNQFAKVDDSGHVRWNDPEYRGRFSDYKAMADMGSLVRLDSTLLNVISPSLLRSFDEVYMLTYLFDGQCQKAYLDYFGFDYRIVGIEEDEEGYFFSDKPDDPPPVDYSELIHLEMRSRMNQIGNGYHTLSKSWYQSRGYKSAEMKKLRSLMRSFFNSIPDGNAQSRLWTSFKNDRVKLVDAKTGRFKNNYLQPGARATNEYRQTTDLAYMINRFIDPNIAKFFSAKGIRIDPEQFALSEMLQWIWRSAIRDGKPINLYIPSKRMRDMLIGWIKETNRGGGENA